ncbi:MAG: MBL fold metallo-hydrolase, partial [Gammaproteobacteria bacterium]|nr:MBL fold metallo-hydrolase [Gemmatimonadota bacterium]NIU80542.1 MBL fold metallo-hydrolase [Gammaproteobacteria bacterium]
DRVEASFDPVRDGDEIEVGGVSIRALATPGHTHESVCYRCGERALATGDTLFLDGVGRPDLKATAEDAERRARRLYASLKE